MFLITTRMKKHVKACVNYDLNPYKIPKICKRAVEKDLYTLEFGPMDLITQEMYNQAIRKFAWFLVYVSDIT